MTRSIAPILSILIAGLMVMCTCPPSIALAPAKEPDWEIGNYWRYEGKLIWVDLNVTFNLTGKGQATIGGNTYDVFILDYLIISKIGPIVSSIQGKQYYDQYEHTLVKTETISTDNKKVRSTVVTYDPPKRQLEFPMLLGNEWTEELTVTTVETVDGKQNTTVTSENNSYKISGVDQLTTVFGTVECYRITVTNKTGATVDYWYSAEIGQFVKLDILPSISNSEVLLVDYSYSMSEGTTNDGPLVSDMLLIIIVVVIVLVVIVAAIVIKSRDRSKRKAAPADALQTTPTSQASGQTTVAQVPPVPPSGPSGPIGTIEDVFLVYKDGRLLHHDARRLKPEVDQDVLGGMLTAIQDFVGRSFPSSDGTPGAVKEIRYADNRILLEKGLYLYLAVVTDVADISTLQSRMVQLVKLIELRCAKDLQTWDGDMGAVSEAKRLSRLILTDEPIPSA